MAAVSSSPPLPRGLRFLGIEVYVLESQSNDGDDEQYVDFEDDSVGSGDDSDVPHLIAM